MGWMWWFSLVWNVLGKTIAPIGEWIYKELKPQVSKTPTKFDDAGLEIFRNFTSQNNLTTDAALAAVLVALEEEVKNDTNMWDDFAYEAVYAAFVAGGLLKKESVPQLKALIAKRS